MQEVFTLLQADESWSIPGPRTVGGVARWLAHHLGRGGHQSDMFVVSGHLYRPLLSSQSWELGGKILGGFGTHPPTFLGAGLSILVFL